MKAFFKKIWNTPLSVRIALFVVSYVLIALLIAAPVQTLFVLSVFAFIASIIRLLVYLTDGH